MKVECILKEEAVYASRELKVESTSSYPQKTVRLIIGDNKIEVDPDELIKAVENCVNC